jgi:hypothetical protein
LRDNSIIQNNFVSLVLLAVELKKTTSGWFLLLLLENMIECKEWKYDYFFNIWLDPKEGGKVSK